MIADALGKGCRKFLLGIGGSATNDGGAQTAGGKTAAGIAKTACRLGIPVVLIAAEIRL